MQIPNSSFILAKRSIFLADFHVLRFCTYLLECLELVNNAKLHSKGLATPCVTFVITANVVYRCTLMLVSTYLHILAPRSDHWISCQSIADVLPLFFRFTINWSVQILLNALSYFQKSPIITPTKIITNSQTNYCGNWLIFPDIFWWKKLKNFPFDRVTCQGRFRLDPHASCSAFLLCIQLTGILTKRCGWQRKSICFLTS